MTASTFLQSNPELIDILADLLSSKFDIPPDMLKTITQKAIATSTRKTNILIDKTLKERLKDINDRFKESGLIGLTKDFLKSKAQAKITPAKEKTVTELTVPKSKELPTLPSIIPSNIQTLGSEKSGSEADRKLTEEKKEPIPVLLAGITNDGEKSLREKLPGIFEDIFKKMPKQEQKEDMKSQFSEKGLLGLLPKGLLGLGAGVALLLGGLGALVAGLQTEGPFKGLLKIFSRVGLEGGLKLLQKSALTFYKSISSFVEAPIRLLQTAAKSITEIFTTGALKGVGGLLKGAKGIFTKMFGGVIKFLTPFVKRIPFVGSLISWGFAYSRFKSGDIVGGAIDLLSGIATLFPGIGTAIGIGLDILNAFLDYKSGGADKKASQKKGNILWDWVKGLGSMIWKGIKYVPVIGPLLDMVESITKGNWFDALWNFARINPLFDPLVGIIEYFTGGNIKEEAQKGVINFASKMLDWGKGLSKWVYEGAKKLPVIGQLIKTGEFLLQGEWSKALVAFSRVIPGVGWVMDMLGFTEEKQLQATEKGLDAIKGLWKWIKDSLWEKVTGFVGSLIDSVKDWWNNLSLDPRSWVGMGPQAPEPTTSQTTQSTSTQSTQQTTPQTTSTPNSAPLSTTPEPIIPISTPEPIIPISSEKIITQTTNPLIGEAAPEITTPSETLLSGAFGDENNILNNKALEDIASNTGDTNNAIGNLTNAIFKLAQTFAKQQPQAGNNIIINGQQQSNIPSASQIAATNVDPIRNIRAQFAI